MAENTIIEFPTPEEGVDYLTRVLRDGAQRLLAQAVEAEAAAFPARHADHVTEDGHRRVDAETAFVSSSRNTAPNTSAA